MTAVGRGRALLGRLGLAAGPGGGAALPAPWPPATASLLQPALSPRNCRCPPLVYPPLAITSSAPQALLFMGTTRSPEPLTDAPVREEKNPARRQRATVLRLPAPQMPERLNQ